MNNRREFIQKALILGSLSIVPLSFPLKSAENKKFNYVFTDYHSHKWNDNSTYLYLWNLKEEIWVKFEGKESYIVIANEDKHMTGQRWKKLKTFHFHYNYKIPKFCGFGELKKIEQITFIQPKIYVQYEII